MCTLGRPEASLTVNPAKYPRGFVLLCFVCFNYTPWWRHRMETLSTLLTFCAENPPVTGEFSAQRPATRSFDVFFDLRLNQQLSKQRRRRWFEMPSGSLWRHCNALASIYSCSSGLPHCSIVWLPLASKVTIKDMGKISNTQCITNSVQRRTWA